MWLWWRSVQIFDQKNSSAALQVEISHLLIQNYCTEQQRYATLNMSVSQWAGEEHMNACWVSAEQLLVIQLLGFSTSTHDEPPSGPASGSREGETVGAPSGRPEEGEEALTAWQGEPGNGPHGVTTSPTEPEGLPPREPPQPDQVSAGANAGQAAVEPEVGERAKVR